jgi:hypothetical protein
VFHVLTSLDRAPQPGRPSPYATFLGLLRDDARIRPISVRKRSQEAFWGTGRALTGTLGNTDELNGDEHLLFFCPYREYDGTRVDYLFGRIAVAYDLDDLMRHGPVGYRPLDLIAPFDQTAEWADREYPGHWRRKQRMLAKVARCYSLFDAGAVRRLVRLEARHLQGDAAARKEADRIWHRAVDRCESEIFWLPWSENSPDFIVATGLHGGAFYTSVRQAGPGTLVDALADGTGTPEILLRGEIPLRAARFYRGPRGIWEEMPRTWPRAKTVASPAVAV